MLQDGKTYLEIAEKTGASTATISRVNRSLNYGAMAMQWSLTVSKTTNKRFSKTAVWSKPCGSFFVF